jgi:hypothetical protein
MTSEHFREVSEARRRQAALQKACASQYPPDSFEGEPANKVINMACSGHAPPRGSILGVVFAGDPDSDPVMEGTPAEDLLDELEVGPNDYFLRVRGFSMRDASILEGDLVQVRPLRPGTIPPDGAIVLAEIDTSLAVGERSGLSTIKKFFRQGSQIRLEPANGSMSPQVYRAEDVVITGIIVYVLSHHKPT